MCIPQEVGATEGPLHWTALPSSSHVTGEEKTFSASVARRGRREGTRYAHLYTSEGGDRVSGPVHI